jgi:hypothetical protein
MTLRRAALWYVRRGFAVFPVQPGTKIPHRRFIGAGGYKNATKSEEQVERWWTVDPTAPVAIACDASGIVVLDGDLYKPECEFGALERELGPLPLTPRVSTQSGGVHFYFRDVGCEYSNPGPGVEAKYRGYVLAPCSPGYRWDLDAHIIDTPIAELPDAWLRHLTEKAGGYLQRPIGAALPSSGTDAADSWLGVAFAEMAWLGVALDGGKRAVRCPWLHEHSDGRGDGQDSSAVLFPRSTGKTLGAFYCSHAHCMGRGYRDVIVILPPKARRAADDAMARERNRITLEQIEKLRKVVGW